MTTTGTSADPKSGESVEDDLDADAILAELEAEAEDNLPVLRQQRIQEQLASANTTSSASGTVSAKIDAAYSTLKSDDATLQFTTEHAKAVVHFFHPDFARCSIMDSHLETIAARHADFGAGADSEDIKFARVDVSHAPFVVERMGIRVLPCVIGFVKGVVKGKVTGFEGLCWDGREKDLRVCRAVEARMVEWGLLRKTLVGQGGDDQDNDEDSDDEDEIKRKHNSGRRGIQGRKQITNNNDDDDDWD